MLSFDCSCRSQDAELVCQVAFVKIPYAPKPPSEHTTNLNNFFIMRAWSSSKLVLQKKANLLVGVSVCCSWLPWAVLRYDITFSLPLWWFIRVQRRPGRKSVFARGHKMYLSECTKVGSLNEFLSEGRWFPVGLARSVINNRLHRSVFWLHITRW